LNARQTRRAVIDACTAAEIALAHQVHEMLSETDRVVIEQLLDRCNGVADVAQVVRKIGVRV
jgi:predicted double-glycine peptidase